MNLELRLVRSLEVRFDAFSFLIMNSSFVKNVKKVQMLETTIEQ